ncbi:hypothetical protein PTKIN_Ptkin18bG0027900 [Pterospermum kingtungense]
MVGIEPAIAGCETGCSGHRNSGLNGTCDGQTCCKAAIPYGLQLFNASFGTKQSKQSESGSDQGCKLAFLVETEWFGYMQPMEYVPALLWWEIDKESLKLQESSKEHSCKNMFLFKWL